MAKAFHLELPNDTPIDPEFLRALNQRFLLIAERLQKDNQQDLSLQGPHVLRLATVAEKQPAGRQFWETDRCSVYIIKTVNNALVWAFEAGLFVGTLAQRPADLTLYDAGFLFYATDALQYRWSGTAWVTLDYVRGGLTLTGVNAIPKVTATGIIGPSAVTDDGTDVILTGRALKLSPLTASLPLKLNASKEAISAKIDLGVAADVAGTGLTANKATMWDGTKLADATGASLPAATLTGDVTGNTGATVVSLVGGSTAANVHAAELLANAATSANTALAIVRRDGSGQAILTNIFATTSVQVPGSSQGSVNIFNGSSTLTGYIEWRKFGGTRLAYLGNDSANLTVNLENSATFVVAGGGAFVNSPANTTKAVMTIDGTQTVTNKDLTATSNTFALPVIQRDDSIALTGQTASVGATNLRVGGATAPAGLYRVTTYVEVTTAGTGGTVQVSATWTDDGAARGPVNWVTINLNATNYGSTTQPVRTNGSADIQISTTVSGATGSPIYALYVTLERIL